MAKNDSIVKVCNSAISEVGSASITELSQASRPARECNTRYAPIVQSVLREHPWNCAITRVRLQQSTETPAYEWAYYYELPADFLRAVSTLNDEPYKIEGRFAASNAGELYMRYVRDISQDPSRWDSSLREAVVMRLAAALAVPLMGNASLGTEKLNAYALLLKKAKSVDAQEDTVEQPDDGDWVTTRTGGSVGGSAYGGI